jgi:SulP family sulfate permease
MQLLGLFLLVCFGSCMDIAAIQQDTPFRLDFNKELTTIGGCRGEAGKQQEAKGG